MPLVPPPPTQALVGSLIPQPPPAIRGLRTRCRGSRPADLAIVLPLASVLGPCVQLRAEMPSCGQHPNTGVQHPASSLQYLRITTPREGADKRETELLKQGVLFLTNFLHKLPSLQQAAQLCDASRTQGKTRQTTVWPPQTPTLLPVHHYQQ